MIDKIVMFFGESMRIVCDERCDKAWGINHRPRIWPNGPANEDDYAYLADHEVGIAPVDPGTYEGGHAKPRTPEERGNKWCVRECERMNTSKRGEHLLPLMPSDFSQRIYNITPRATQ